MRALNSKIRIPSFITPYTFPNLLYQAITIFNDALLYSSPPLAVFQITINQLPRIFNRDNLYQRIQMAMSLIIPAWVPPSILVPCIRCITLRTGVEGEMLRTIAPPGQHHSPPSGIGARSSSRSPSEGPG